MAPDAAGLGKSIGLTFTFQREINFSQRSYIIFFFFYTSNGSKQAVHQINLQKVVTSPILSLLLQYIFLNFLSTYEPVAVGSCFSRKVITTTTTTTAFNPTERSLQCLHHEGQAAGD